jgi:heptosyltransferase II
LRAKNLPSLIMPASVEKILVRGVNWLGDAVMTTPALMRLRLALPKARITLLTPEKLAGLWEGQTFIDEVLTFNGTESVLQVGRRLRGMGFDTGIAFPNSIRSALELWLGRIPQRIGAGRRLLLTQSIGPRGGAIEMRKRTGQEIRERVRDNSPPQAIESSAHHVYHYLHLVTALGASAEILAPRIDVSADAMARVREKFGLVESAGQRWFGLIPGAEYGPAKRWPAERFVEAAVALRRKTNCRWVIFGGGGDRDLAEQIAREAGEPIVNLAGKTTLAELAAALKVCDFVLTNDTGPMHLAAAVGARMAAIFGSTSPELTGPVFWPQARIVRQPVPCAPCFLRECPIDLRCLRGISTETVVAAAIECLK